MRFVYNRETKKNDFLATLADIKLLTSTLNLIDCEGARCCECPLEYSQGCVLNSLEEFLTEQKNKLLRERGE